MAKATIQHTTPEGTATQLLEEADRIRMSTNSVIDPERRGRLGQFMTSTEVATFMAAMFETRRQHIRLLDPGAGTGSLTAAFVAHMLCRKPKPKSILVTAYEVDANVAEGLLETLNACERACEECGVSFAFDVRRTDYIRDCAGHDTPLWSPARGGHDCVIMNPPYHKINGQSETRSLLRSMGIETSNLYSAFMLLAARQLAAGSEFVSITPRSFCNGPYFQRFRREFLNLLAVKRIHVFESRTDAFRQDAVLQENVVVHALRNAEQAKEVLISQTEADGRFSERSVSFSQVVRPHDRERVIHIVVNDRGDIVSRRMLGLQASIEDLGLRVSTGRVVDFRAREYLRDKPARGTAPLIFPAHMRDGRIMWPNGNTRKPNAIVDDGRTSNLLVEAGFYVLIKRFSAKEERRRVVAALYDPREIDAARVGFDNKTNYIHSSGNGLPEILARGLTVFLNSSMVDEYFRLFSGHTQVNAADLRRLPYPTEDQLVTLARFCTSLSDQQEVDHALEAIF